MPRLPLLAGWCSSQRGRCHCRHPQVPLEPPEGLHRHPAAEVGPLLAQALPPRVSPLWPWRYRHRHHPCRRALVRPMRMRSIRTCRRMWRRLRTMAVLVNLRRGRRRNGLLEGLAAAAPAPARGKLEGATPPLRPVQPAAALHLLLPSRKRRLLPRLSSRFRRGDLSQTTKSFTSWMSSSTTGRSGTL